MKFAIPSPQTPGYLRRISASKELQKSREKSDPDANDITFMCDFLLPYIVEPADREEARNALLDASEEEYKELMLFVNGGGAENPTVTAESKTS